MVEHANRYLSSGGADGHMYKISQPGRPDLTVPSLLLTTTGRKSGEQFIFPLFYGKTGNSYLVIASKGAAPQHPGWYRNILANPHCWSLPGGSLNSKVSNWPTAVFNADGGLQERLPLHHDGSAQRQWRRVDGPGAG